MSYILEALKKLELKTEQSGMPSLLSHTEVAEHRRSRLWLYPLIAVLFLNAVMIFWWVRPWWPKEPQTIVQLPAVHPKAPAAPIEPPAKTRETNQSDNIREAPKETQLTNPRVSVPRKEGRDAPLSNHPKTNISAVESYQPQPSPEKRTASHGRVLALNELPSSVRHSLPQLKVSGHAYSPDPGSRVARINDQILQEGQSLAPGLKVEEITPSGIVLGYQGYRFQIGINSN